MTDIPYIDRGQRADLEPVLQPLREQIKGLGPGALNYVLSSLVLAWLPDTPSYAGYNAAIGVLECAKIELYRKQISRYEDAKMVKHGTLTGWKPLTDDEIRRSTETALRLAGADVPAPGRCEGSD